MFSPFGGDSSVTSLFGGSEVELVSSQVIVLPTQGIDLNHLPFWHSFVSVFVVQLQQTRLTWQQMPFWGLSWSFVPSFSQVNTKATSLTHPPLPVHILTWPQTSHWLPSSPILSPTRRHKLFLRYLPLCLILGQLFLQLNWLMSQKYGIIDQ